MTPNTLVSAKSVKVDRLVGLGLALAALSLYVSTLAPTVLEADGGEFQFVPWLPGIPHPTGYPLYTLLGWVWTHLLPVGEVAWRMNLLSAVFAAGAVGFTYGVTRQLVQATLPQTTRSAQVLAAAGAAILFAISPTFWSQAIVAEVYSLHATFVAIMLWLALKLRQEGYTWHTPTGRLLTFTFGLSLAHHSTTVLLFPALVLFLWRGRNPAKASTSNSFTNNQQASVRPRSGIRPWLIHSLLMIAPLLLYLYLPLIAPVTPYASLTLSDTKTLTLYKNSFQGFWEHVTGTVFTDELRPQAVGLDRLRLSWQLLLQEVGWGGVLVALAGLVTLWHCRRINLLLLTGLSFVAFVTFSLIYFIGDVFVLFIPAWLMVSLWIGLGALGLAHHFANGFVRRRTSFGEPPTFEALNQRLSQGIYRLVLLIFVIGVLVIVLVALLATRSDMIISQKNNTAARERWQEILAEPVPQGSILLSNDRNEIMPMWYYQYVEGRRPDLLGLFPLIVADPAYANVGRVLDQALASGRPVYLIKPMNGLSLKANLIPAGTLFRATTISDSWPTYPHHTTLPEIVLNSASGQNLSETIKLVGYDITPATAAPGDEVAITLHWQPVQILSIDYTSFVHLLDGEGQGVTQSDHRPGGEFYPSSYWQIGENLRDQHLVTIPLHTPPGQYRLQVGMYYQPEPGLIKGMGHGEEIGLVTIR